MPEIGNTIRLHRILKAPTERLYRAFIDSVALASWLPPNGFTCEIHFRDPVPGGTYKISFTNFTTQERHSWQGQILEMVHGKILKYTDKFDDPSLSEKIVTTVELREVICGSEIFVTQENLPKMIPTELAYLGWQESLEKLARLVEPEIKAN